MNIKTFKFIWQWGLKIGIDLIPNFFASFPEKEFIRFLKQDLRIDNCSKSYTILIDDFDLEGNARFGPKENFLCGI